MSLHLWLRSLWAAPLVGKPKLSYFVIRLALSFLKNLFIAVRLVKNSDSFMGLDPCGSDLGLQEVHIHALILSMLSSFGL